MNKAGKILLIYDRLRLNGKINKKEIMLELHISESTFESYMSEIRCHLLNSFNYSESLVYDRIEKDYKLIKNQRY